MSFREFWLRLAALMNAYVLIQSGPPGWVVLGCLVVAYGAWWVWRNIKNDAAGLGTKKNTVGM